MSELIEIKVEDPGNTDEVEVVEYFVSEGDSVDAGAPLLEIATDKANMELEAPAGGVVEKLLYAQGDIVPADVRLRPPPRGMSQTEAPEIVTGRGEPETVKLSLMRRAMVRSSVAGAAVPVFYLRLTADVTDLVAARARSVPVRTGAGRDHQRRRRPRGRPPPCARTRA